MLGFHALSEAPFSDLAGDIKLGSSSLSSVATVSATPTVHIRAKAAKQADASVTSDGLVLKLGQAHIASISPFTLGFNYGFQHGSQLVARGAIRQNELICTSTLTANGTVILGDVIFEGTGSLQSQANFSGNSVLLVGGVGNIEAQIAFKTAILTNLYEQSDQILLTLYIEKLREYSLSTGKSGAFTNYIDKQRLSDLKVDKLLSEIKYIDKLIEKDLVREK